VAYRIQNTGVWRVRFKRKRGPRYQIASGRQLADAMRGGRRLVKIMSVRGPIFEVGGRSVDPAIVKGARGRLRVEDRGLLHDRDSAQSWTMETFDGSYE
jgi:hypothetical protein